MGRAERSRRSAKKDTGEAGPRDTEAEDDIESIFSEARLPEKSPALKERREDDESDGSKYFSVGEGGRRYHDGLPVYTVEELQLGEGGGDTEDCPIYCCCCT